MTEHKSLRMLAAENPSLILILGICPLFGSTADVRAALGMGCLVLVALLASSLIMGLLKHCITRQFVVPAAFLVCAGVVSVLELLFHAWFPGLYQILGVYVSVLSVSLLLFAATADSCEQSVEKAISQALVVGLIFLAVLLSASVIREVFGNASFAGIEIPALKDYKINVLVQPGGALLTGAFLAAVLNAVAEKATSSEAVSDWFAASFGNAEKKEESES